MFLSVDGAVYVFAGSLYGYGHKLYLCALDRDLSCASRMPIFFMPNTLCSVTRWSGRDYFTAHGIYRNRSYRFVRLCRWSLCRNGKLRATDALSISIGARVLAGLCVCEWIGATAYNRRNCTNIYYMRYSSLYTKRKNSKCSQSPC